MKRVCVSLSVLAVLALSWMLVGCGSSPSASSGRDEVPEWVLNPPESDEQYFYFSGSGRSGSGSLAEAEEIARGALLDEIMRFLGVRITSETTATAKASLDSYQTEVIQSLTSTASGRVTGLEIADKYADQRSGGTTLYLLARYNRADLLKEKGRLEGIFQEKIEAVSRPEREAQELAARKLYYQAALRYIEAAAAAYKSELENAAIKFERNITRATEAVREIGLIKLNDNLAAEIGRQFTEPFSVKIVAGSAAGDPGIADVALRATYKEMKSSGRKGVRTQVLKTDREGMARFLHPAPQFVGREEVILALDMGEALESLEDVPPEMQDLVDGLERMVLAKRVKYLFESVSPAAGISMGVAVFDLDASGSPLNSAETSAGLLSGMGEVGFSVRSLPVAVTNVAGRQDAQVIALLKKNFSGQVSRAVYGSARISDHQQDGQIVIIQVTGTIKVVDLETEAILLTVNKVKRAQGTNPAAALAAAFKQLGDDMAQAVMNQLR
jgi:hypothetical protein